MEEASGTSIGSYYADFTKTLSKTLIFLFRLAWSSRVSLPTYLTMLSLVGNVRLSIEIRFGEPEVDDFGDEEVDDGVDDDLAVIE